MVAASRDWYHTRLMHPPIAGSDFVVCPLKLKRLLYPGVANIRNTTEVKGGNPRSLVDLTQETRLITDFPRPVSGSGPIRHTSVEGDPYQANVYVGELLRIRRTHEGWETSVARSSHRVCKFRVGNHTISSSQQEVLPPTSFFPIANIAHTTHASRERYRQPHFACREAVPH
jgi:hypothetical protein